LQGLRIIFIQRIGVAWKMPGTTGLQNISGEKMNALEKSPDVIICKKCGKCAVLMWEKEDETDEAIYSCLGCDESKAALRYLQSRLPKTDEEKLIEEDIVKMNAEKRLIRAKQKHQAKIYDNAYRVVRTRHNKPEIKAVVGEPDKRRFGSLFDRLFHKGVKK